ncbi:MAG TPA: hypothetical protein VJZ91_11205 [Blastocatellia bacterium]|nr:hypothetical protein [Blastocatellia bacterium]
MLAQRKSAHRLMSRLTVAVLVDEDCWIPGTSRLWAGQPERHVINALRRLANRVVLGLYTGVDELSRWLKEVRPDVVFNLTERAAGDRNKDSHLCALLDLLELPYTGPGPRGLMLCRDKAVSKLIAQRAGFKIPEFFVVESKTLRLPAGIRFPLVVKPRFGDASEGISQRALVHTREALVQRIALLGRGAIESLICEEFIAGREMLVGMIGPRVFPVREFIVGRPSASPPLLFSDRLKHDPAHRRRWSARMDFAKLTAGQERQIKELTRRTSSALELRDYGRLDLRLTPSGEWVFLEANPNPALVPFRRSFSGSWAGIDFAAAIAEITLRALRRRP